jgi:hypothetical protein
MTGRIKHLIDDQQIGLIAGEDGVDYLFTAPSLFRIVFEALHVGAPVTFVPNPETKRATLVRIAVPPIIERPRS